MWLRSATGWFRMACKRSGVRIPVAPLPSSNQNSNSRREAAFLFSRLRSGAAPRGGMENVQVRYEVWTVQGLADDFLQRMQAHFEVAIR